MTDIPSFFEDPEQAKFNDNILLALRALEIVLVIRDLKRDWIRYSPSTVTSQLNHIEKLVFNLGKDINGSKAD
jgi:hypothetical protein